MKAVFFDRDGVINEDLGYVYRIEDFVFRDGFFELLDFFKKNQYLLFVITNQSGIARGYYSIEDFKKLSDFMQEQIAKRLGFGFDGVYFCPHLDDCNCRKPDIGMIEDICRKYSDIDLKKSILIGDKNTDVLAGINAGIATNFLVGKTDVGFGNSVVVVRDLLELKDIILQRSLI